VHVTQFPVTEDPEMSYLLVVAAVAVHIMQLVTGYQTVPFAVVLVVPPQATQAPLLRV